jgi:hypothetical protein
MHAFKGGLRGIFLPENLFYSTVRRKETCLKQKWKDMNKYVINPGAVGQREILATKYQLESGYFWFFGFDNQVVSINKADYVDRIDLIN